MAAGACLTMSGNDLTRRANHRHDAIIEELARHHWGASSSPGLEPTGSKAIRLQDQLRFLILHPVRGVPSATVLASSVASNPGRTATLDLAWRVFSDFSITTLPGDRYDLALFATLRRLSGLQRNICASSHKELLEQFVIADISGYFSQCEERHQRDEHDQAEDKDFLYTSSA
jgi:hypothetical protein